MFNIPDNNWGFLNDERMKELESIYEKVKGNIFPTEDKVLRFLEADYNSLKYVIVGMEPYPTATKIDGMMVPEATGRSFEVASVNSWCDKFRQSSLRNILKSVIYAKTGEIVSMEKARSLVTKGDVPMMPPHQWFDSLEKQGVLFLNASLTVEPNNVGSHEKLWDKFMTELICHIDKVEGVKWLLWGQVAQNRVLPHIDSNKASLARHPRLNEFIDDNCFKENNAVNWLGTES